MHLIRSGTEIGWHRPGRCRPGSCPRSRPASAASRRPAEIAPGAYGAIALPDPAYALGEADAVALEVSGYLRDALPEGAAYRAFSVRTADVPLGE